MRIEINHDNTILLFIEHSELVERGFLMENHSENVELINEIVDDVLLFAASSTDYFSIDGSYVTEASYVPNEGAYIKITMLHDQVRKINDKQVSHTSNLATPVYVFAHVDDLIDCAMKVPAHLRETGSVYHYQNRYYLLLDESDAQEDRDRSLLVAIVLEYGTKTDLTQAVLLEYGKMIWDADALKQIADVFK